MKSLLVFVAIIFIIVNAKVTKDGQCIKYYHDRQKNMCMATACPKSSSVQGLYDTKLECSRDTNVADFFNLCGANDGYNGTCMEMDERRQEKFTKCAPGHTCQRGFSIANCCNDAKKKQYDAEREAACYAPMETVRDEEKVPSSDDVLRGLKCSDNFCPTGSKCIQGKYLAHCCQCKGIKHVFLTSMDMCLAMDCNRAATAMQHPDTYDSAFHTRAECGQHKGSIMDLSGCGGGEAPTGECWSRGDRGLDEKKCPKGHSCYSGFEVKYCCNDNNQKIWESEYAAKCDAPMTTVRVEKDAYNGDVLRGKNCTDNFCPKGSKCVQGKYLAHCCAEPEKCEGIRFVMDDAVNMCFAYHCTKVPADAKYILDSHRNCSMFRSEDHNSCGGGVPSKGECYNQFTDRLTHEPPKKCPDGHTCVHGMIGLCCDTANQEKWRQDMAAKCDDPLKTVLVEKSGPVLRGKKCSDNFCPSGSKCIQGKHLAHCCA